MARDAGREHTGTGGTLPGIHDGVALAGRYRLVALLGSGGMAQVWRGTDEVLDRPVAIKLMDARLLSIPSFRDRFRVEAQAVARLSHPRIVAVHDYGEASAADGTVLPYIVMELLTGQTLAQRLRAGPLPWPTAVRVCMQLGEALTAAHAQGVVHRDVKPANVVLTPAGARVLDFGIAEAALPGPDGPDGLGGLGEVDGVGGDRVLGTPTYLAPERRATAAADVYALGLVLAETLGGTDARDRLAAGAPAGLASAAETGSVGTGGPAAEIEWLCRRCAAADPKARPTAAEVTVALAGFAGEPGAAAQAGGAARPDGSAAEAGTLSDATARDGHTRVLAGSRVPRPVRSATMLKSVAVAVLVAVVAAVVAIAGRGTLGNGAAAPSPHATARATAPGTAPASAPAVPARAAAALVRARTDVAQGLAHGQVRSDVALDLNNVIANLMRQLAQGQGADLAQNFAALQQKVATRLREGAVSPSLAQILESDLRRS